MTKTSFIHRDISVLRSACEHLIACASRKRRKHLRVYYEHRLQLPVGYLSDPGVVLDNLDSINLLGFVRS